MSVLRFRAILVDPGNSNQERPVQIFGNSRTEIDPWAKSVLGAAVSAAARVEVYETREQLVDSITRPPADGEGKK